MVERQSGCVCRRHTVRLLWPDAGRLRPAWRGRWWSRFPDEPLQQLCYSCQWICMADETVIVPNCVDARAVAVK